jgi:hypothetical protein
MRHAPGQQSGCEKAAGEKGLDASSTLLPAPLEDVASGLSVTQWDDLGAGLEIRPMPKCGKVAEAETEQRTGGCRRRAKRPRATPATDEQAVDLGVYPSPRAQQAFRSRALVLRRAAKDDDVELDALRDGTFVRVVNELIGESHERVDELRVVAPEVGDATQLRTREQKPPVDSSSSAEQLTARPVATR